MKILKARVYEKMQDEKRSEMEKFYGEKGEIGWGSQISSYVFQPYQLVKDLRTGSETGNVQAVMDGDLDRVRHRLACAPAVRATGTRISWSRTSGRTNKFFHLLPSRNGCSTEAVRPRMGLSAREADSRLVHDPLRSRRSGRNFFVRSIGQPMPGFKELESAFACSGTV